MEIFSIVQTKGPKEDVTERMLEFYESRSPAIL